MYFINLPCRGKHLFRSNFWQSLLLSYYPTQSGRSESSLEAGTLNIPDQANTMKVSPELVRHHVPIGWYRRGSVRERCAHRPADARRRAPSQGCTMKKVINSAPSRRHFLRLTSMAAASALAPTVLCAEQREAGESAASQAVSARIATFEEVWRTVRDRFYDPHLHGLVRGPGTLHARRHRGELQRGAGQRR